MPRSLATAVRRFVSATSRGRGESYFVSGRVSVTRVSASTFAAVVRGTRTYNVSLTLDEHRLVVDCSCPYFEDSINACKHIWAVILAADRAHAFQVPDELFLDVHDVRIDALSESPLTPAPPSPRADWQTFLSHVTPVRPEGPPVRLVLPGELIYVVDLVRSATAGGLLIELLTRDRKKSGEWGKPKAVTINRHDIVALPDERDRQILDAVCGAAHAHGYFGPTWSGYSVGVPVPTAFVLNLTLQRDLARRLAETGRLLLRVPATPGVAHEKAVLVPLDWDPEPAEFHLRITGDAREGYTIGGDIHRGGQAYAVGDAMFVTAALIVWRPAAPDGRPRLAAFDTGGADRWMAGLLDVGRVTVPASEAAALVETLVISDLARLECPEELRVESRAEPPRPIVRITRPTVGEHRWHASSDDRLDAKLSFAYGDGEVDAWSEQPVFFDPERRLAWRRDPEAERAAFARLQLLGVRRLADWQSGGGRLDLATAQLASVVRVLLSEGWRVEAEGRLYHRPGAVSLDVRSGIDWFELHGAVEYGGVSVDLPTLLAAAHRGDTFVPLGDGTFGLLPEHWLARAARMTAVGMPVGDHVRFSPNQGALLDAWLATQPAVSCRRRLRACARRAGTVRGRGSRSTRRRRSAASCASTSATRSAGSRSSAGSGSAAASPTRWGSARPSWCSPQWRPDAPNAITIAARRSPRSSSCRARSCSTGTRRRRASHRACACSISLARAGATALDHIADYDIILTTYGTLRRDIGHLKEITFDYAILDEAQTIKNSRTSSAKAARLLKASHRLALSGTPVENHLGELWSLFDFLNPGMLGAASVFAAATTAESKADDGTLEMLARGLRPFILRRTKELVAAELPARTEQTLYCDLEPPQRALYDELRDHYRAALLGKSAPVGALRGNGSPTGLGRSKMQILEALLRLRQAACHPGLIDRVHAVDPSAKLDVLVPRLQELVEDGRKVIVFSQFTTLLGFLRTRLDEVRLTYEYLDGKTRDREARVRRFQGDGCPLFLVSLKAGGLGLNLTAAEYVFLLDPWWNPAVEAQAIDRAHRIGQTRPVFAFRLIARDTVEEKVLELQATKRKLAEAIVRADVSLIRDLRREDLELLLS